MGHAQVRGLEDLGQEPANHTSRPWWNIIKQAIFHALIGAINGSSRLCVMQPNQVSTRGLIRTWRRPACRAGSGSGPWMAGHTGAAPAGAW